MDKKLIDIINPKIGPWLRALESQAKNITLSDGTVLGVVSSKKEQPMPPLYELKGFGLIT